MKNAYDHVEQEQLEELKDWWKNYGKATIITIVLAIAAGLSWRYWDQAQERHLEQASQTYEALLAAVDNGQAAEIDAHAHNLIEQYTKTDYASMAALFLAKEAVLKGDWDKAAEKLRWVIDTSKIAPTRQIARIRLARILLADQKIEEAFSMVEKIEDKAWIPLINAIKGDLYSASKKTD
ncbi:MAG: YfgM family protein, partial [Gammaproteobacteria bacterium]